MDSANQYSMVSMTKGDVKATGFVKAMHDDNGDVQGCAGVNRIKVVIHPGLLDWLNRSKPV